MTFLVCGRRANSIIGIAPPVHLHRIIVPSRGQRLADEEQEAAAKMVERHLERRSFRV